MSTDVDRCVPNYRSHLYASNICAYNLCIVHQVAMKQCCTISYHVPCMIRVMFLSLQRALWEPVHRHYFSDILQVVRNVFEQIQKIQKSIRGSYDR